MSIKKNNLLIFIICLALLIFSTSCTSLGESAGDLSTPSTTSGESARDLSTPKTMIVGHWGIFAAGIPEPRQELYFGEFDEDGIAPCIWVKKIKGTFTYTCKIISETISADNHKVIIGFSSEEYSDEFSEEFTSFDDGKIFWRASSSDQFQYIDSKTEP
jgi:hypothetical protein